MILDGQGEAAQLHKALDTTGPGAGTHPLPSLDGLHIEARPPAHHPGGTSQRSPQP